jgi:uncharacterized RDD family membrane protein YckC
MLDRMTSDEGSGTPAAQGPRWDKPQFPPPQEGSYGPPATQGYGYGGGLPPAPPVPPGASVTPFPPLPPGIEPASHGRRVGAYFLAFPLLIVTLVIGYLIWGLVLWGKGTSPALRVLGLRCVDAQDGTRVGFGRMVLRDLVGGIVQGILGAVTALVSFILFLATGKRQTLPDLVGSTVVVYDPNRVLD